MCPLCLHLQTMPVKNRRGTKVTAGQIKVESPNYPFFSLLHSSSRHRQFTSTIKTMKFAVFSDAMNAVHKQNVTQSFGRSNEGR